MERVICVLGQALPVDQAHLTAQFGDPDEFFCHREPRPGEHRRCCVDATAGLVTDLGKVLGDGIGGCLWIGAALQYGAAGIPSSTVPRLNKATSAARCNA